MNSSINTINPCLVRRQKHMPQLSLKLDQLCTLQVAGAAAEFDR
jgi:hypothetical protein